MLCLSLSPQGSETDGFQRAGRSLREAAPFAGSLQGRNLVSLVLELIEKEPVILWETAWLIMRKEIEYLEWRGH